MHQQALENPNGIQGFAYEIMEFKILSLFQLSNKFKPPFQLE
jgi:hypothetical protein